MDLLDHLALSVCVLFLKSSQMFSWFSTEELGCSMALSSSHVCACALNIRVCTCPALRVIGVFWSYVDYCGIAEQSWGLSVT